MQDGKKYRTVSVRFTEEDFDRLNHNCEQYNFKNISEYIRFLVLDEDADITGATRENEKQTLERMNFGIERILMLLEIEQQTLLESVEVLYRRTKDNSALPKEEKAILLERSKAAIEAIKTTAVSKVKAFHESDEGEDPFLEELYLNYEEDKDDDIPVEYDE